MSEGPPPLPEIPRYEARLTYFDKIRIYRIIGDRLQFEEEGRMQNFPLSEIQSLRCRFFPTRFQLDRYEMIISFSSGLNLKIGNQLFRGMADFEDRSPAYRDFVIALHEARGKLNPPCQFFAGVTPLSFWLNAFFLGGVLLLVAFLVVIFATSIPVVALIKLVILIIMLPIAINWFRKNKPRQYESNSIPPEIIPS